jgi:hypothetical protein
MDETERHMQWRDRVDHLLNRFFMPVWWTLLVIGIVLAAVGFFRLPTVY